MNLISLLFYCNSTKRFLKIFSLYIVPLHELKLHRNGLSRVQASLALRAPLSPDHVRWDRQGSWSHWQRSAVAKPRHRLLKWGSQVDLAEGSETGLSLSQSSPARRRSRRFIYLPPRRMMWWALTQRRLWTSQLPATYFYLSLVLAVNPMVTELLLLLPLNYGTVYPSLLGPLHCTFLSQT